MSNMLFSGERLTVGPVQADIAEIVLDCRGDSVNKLDTALVAELDQALDAITATQGLRGVLLSSGKNAFLAGADIAVLLAMCDWSPEALMAFCAESDRVLTRLEDLPLPVVCAVNGYALGGGLETALSADYRVLAGDAMIGFPEVGLGILPGLGGCVRTPRLAGCATAVEWISGGRHYQADAALAAGMVDELAEPAALREAALARLRQAMAEPAAWQARREQRRGSHALDQAAIDAARVRAARVQQHQPAAAAIINLLERAAGQTRDEAFALEAETFAALVRSPAAKALVTVFLAGQQIKKKSRGLATAPGSVRCAAVLGAGIMGGGIAYTSAVKGLPVLLKDIARPALDLGMNEARKLLAKQVESGRLKADKAERILGSITPMLEFERFDSADIVIEAVVENLKLKQQVLADVETRVRPGTVLASNTSSLSIAEIAAPLQRPQDVVGMHFFNPVHMMPLVEVIRGPRSSDAAIARTVSYALAMGKSPLVVRDCPGFLINRILGAYFSAFLLLVREGVDFARIDGVMEAWGWPMGPSYLIDVAGIDTLDKAMVILGKAYPQVMAADFDTAIALLAREKRYGQKTGVGFYRYEIDPRGKPKRSADPETYALLANVQLPTSSTLGDAEILDRMMLAMVLEAGRCLDENIVDSAVELDAGMRLGTGFPAYHGGPLWTADVRGLAAIVAQCRALASLGGLYVPSAGFRERAASGRRYYDGLVANA